MSDSRFPTAINSEVQILATVLYDPSAMSEIMDVVRVEDFYMVEHQRVYKIILGLHAKGAPIESRTILAEAEKSSDGVGDMVGLLASIEQQASMDFRPGFHAAEIVEAANLRAIMAACQWAGFEASSRKGSSVVSAKLIDMALAIRGRERFKPARGPEEAALAAQRDMLEKADAVRSGKVVSHETYLSNVDNLLGGLNVGEYTVLAASQSLGKSTMCANIAKNNAIRGVPVLYLTIEMSELALRGKLLQTFENTTLTANKVVRGLLDDDDRMCLARDTEVMKRWPLMIEEGAQTLTSIRAAIVRARLFMSDLKLVIVDGLYCMSSEKEGRSENRTQEVSAMSRGLKGMCSEKTGLGVHMLVTHQFSKDQEKRGNKKELDRGSGARPVMGDLKDSGGVPQDADIVMFLHRDRVDDTGKAPERVETEVIIAKNRNHQIGTVKVVFHSKRQRFTVH